MAAAFKKSPENQTLVLEAHQVLVRPLVTEKSTHASEKLNAYAFEVHDSATKDQIKAAVEYLWEVRVKKVRTQHRHGKPCRVKGHAGHRRDWKRAIVELHEDDRISFY